MRPSGNEPQKEAVNRFRPLGFWFVLPDWTHCAGAGLQPAPAISSSKRTRKRGQVFADVRKVVFPLHPIVWTADGPTCGCGGIEGCPGPGKHPATRYAELECGGTVARPRAGAGAGIKCGAAPKGSGIFVVEADSAEAEAWLQAQGMPATLTVLSGSGRGHHYYLQHPGFRVKTCAGLMHPTVDVRGDGGIVVAPGSPHKSGSAYKIVRDMAPATAPTWMLDWLRANQGAAPRTGAPLKPFTAADGSVSTGDWLVDLASERGWLGREIRPGMFAVRCPNEDEHSSGGDTSTVLYVHGALDCKHAHCAGVRRDHLVALFGGWVSDAEWADVESVFNRDDGPAEPLTAQDLATLRAFVDRVPPDAIRTELGNVLAAVKRIGARKDDGSRAVQCPCGGQASVTVRGRYRCTCGLKTKESVLRALLSEASNG